MEPAKTDLHFVPPADFKQLMDRLHNEHKYNLLASNMMSLHRTLPDPRREECKTLSYPEKLPKASVVNNISQRSLDDAIANGLEFHIRIIRTSKREGLIRARLIGAQNAKGSVLIFLDAHTECSQEWLQPLLSRIASDRSVISVPLIDGISSDDMKYEFNTETFINGFAWTLGFTWMSIPKRELIRTHYDKTATIRTPTLVGCAFAVDREFFFEIGAYDAGMNIWGSENIEMSLRVWQCGGSMEVVPCSRIGHLYRRSTYSFGGDVNAVIAQNSVRVVEVWMSDLKHLYYAVTPGHRNVSTGDLTDRFEIKNRLKCKSFRWFLENVYPESNMLLEFLGFGEIKSWSEKKCADIHYGNDNSTLAMYDCHGQGGNQMFAFAKNQMIATQNSEQCVGANSKLDAVIVAKCVDHDSQYWKYDKQNKWMVHVASGYCMQANKTEVILGQCDSFNKNFNWEITSTL
ncbi:hypothetical protein HA402_012577 [Bradysia odoriphaga]|nr:hypothetical protein HA402_012577 [Bradysia odoriphaga]